VVRSPGRGRMSSARHASQIRLGEILSGSLCIFAVSCSYIGPPPQPPQALLGCCRLSGEVLEFASDSLPYKVPPVIGLTAQRARLGKTDSWTVKGDFRTLDS